MRLSSTAFSATFPTLFLGLAASAQLVAFFVYFKAKPDWSITTLFFIMTTGIYLLNRISDKEDKFNNLLRWRFFNESPVRTTVWKSVSITALLIPILILLSTSNFNTALRFAIISIIGFIYTIQIIPVYKDKKLHWINIKAIPVAKTIVVSGIWAGSAIAITASALNISIFRHDLLLLFISIFIGTTNNTITSDVRDIPGDQLRNITTIPTILGLRKTSMLLLYVSSAGMLLGCVFLLKGLVDTPCALFSMLIIIWTYLCALPHYVQSFPMPKTVGAILLESDLIFVASGLIALGIFR